MNKIFVEDNFLNDSECKFLIDFHNQKSDHHFYHRDTKITDLTPLYNENDYIRYLLSKLSFFAQSCYNDINIFLDFAQIVEWENNGMLPHKDYDFHPMTSIVYLNDDYEGGETFVDDVAIIPRSGKIVCFNGSESMHGVNNFSNKRYTIASWFSYGKYILRR